MYQDFDKVLISKEQLQKRVKELADQISKDYAGEKVFLICILKGSVLFCADLFRELSIPAQIDFMVVSSYKNGTTSTGNVEIIKDLKKPIEGMNVIIIEDIVDSGNTLFNLKKLLLTRNPKSLKLCTLLDKPDRRVCDIQADYSGFTIPDEFVVGYGLDYNEDYRQYPEVYILSRHVYEK